MGLQDKLLPLENSRILASGLQNAKVLEYSEYGHDIMTEGGDEVIEDILAFLQEVDSANKLL